MARESRRRRGSQTVACSSRRWRAPFVVAGFCGLLVLAAQIVEPAFFGSRHPCSDAVHQRGRESRHVSVKATNPFSSFVKQVSSMFSNPVDEAKATMEKLQAAAAAEAEADLKNLRIANLQGITTTKSLVAAMTAAADAKAKAVTGAAKLGAEKSDDAWPAEFQKLAFEISTAIDAFESAVVAAENRSATLEKTIEGVVSGSETRAAKVQAELDGYDKEAKDAVADMVEDATMPVTDGALLRLYVLTKATRINLLREMRLVTEGSKALSGDAIMKDMEAAASEAKAVKEAKEAAEKEAAERAAAAIGAATSASKAESTPASLEGSRSSQAGGSSGITGIVVVVAAALLAASAFWADKAGIISLSQPTEVPAEITKSAPPATKSEEITKSAPPATKSEETTTPSSVAPMTEEPKTAPPLPPKIAETTTPAPAKEGWSYGKKK